MKRDKRERKCRERERSKERDETNNDNAEQVRGGIALLNELQDRAFVFERKEKRNGKYPIRTLSSAA